MVNDRFVLINDGDGHWFVVPTDRQEQFHKIVASIGAYWDRVTCEYEECPTMPRWAAPVDGSPSLVEFTGYVIR